jgi:two-component system cell cycle response regulator DivK
MMNRGKKILIVDDDNRNIFALRVYLDAKGFECIAASSSADAINLLNNETSIGIVLMDMMMPDMDGFEAIMEIRRKPALQDLPVIAVTAQAMQGDREKCITAGADNYIPKPVDIDALIKLLDEYLN